MVESNRETGGVAVRNNVGRDLSSGGLLLALLLALSCYYVNLARDSYMDDFRAFYVASEALQDHLDPYVNHVDVNEKYADALWLRKDSRFIYPPTALFVVRPVARVPYKVAKIAFGTLMTLTMVGMLWGLHRRYPELTLVILAAFLCLPMFMNIDNGNIDVLILALVLAAFYLEDGFGAGACLAVAICIKFAPVLVLMWFVIDRRWKTVLWGVSLSAVAGIAALARWGGGYYREFFDHLVKHGRQGMPVLEYALQSVHKVQDRVIVTADGLFSYQHDIGGYAQNPLRHLGSAGAGVGVGLLLVFSGWLALRGAKYRLTRAQGFFLFLVVSLLANPLLWAMGLVACLPLLFELVHTARKPNVVAALLLVPLFLTKQVIGEQAFLVWLCVAAYCVWQSDWFSLREQSLP